MSEGKNATGHLLQALLMATAEANILSAVEESGALLQEMIEAGRTKAAVAVWCGAA